MDAKKAYRGAKAALRTAEQIKQELKGRNLALAYGARPSQKEAQAAQKYVEDLEHSLSRAENEVARLLEQLVEEQNSSQAQYDELIDLEEQVDELEAEVFNVHQRLLAAKVIGISALFGLVGHLLYWHWDEFPSFW